MAMIEESWQTQYMKLSKPMKNEEMKTFRARDMENARHWSRLKLWDTDGSVKCARKVKEADDYHK
jgi:hypothetical protein